MDKPSSVSSFLHYMIIYIVHGYLQVEIAAVMAVIFTVQPGTPPIDILYSCNNKHEMPFMHVQSCIKYYLFKFRLELF